MCGLVGILGPTPDGVGVEIFGDALARIAHRGPDDVGYLSLDATGAIRLSREPPAPGRIRLALGHRRLSILDLTEAGWQPMQSPDGRYTIVFNGEIYNQSELRTELEQRGYVFRSRSDTEVLLAAYTHWGRDCPRRLIGMFAFAVIDAQRQTLFLARDPFGIKPLYYANVAGGLAFASEIKALLSIPGVESRVDAQRLHDYLTTGISDHGDRTFFGGLRQLPAAHHMEVNLARPTEARVQRYWRIEPKGGEGLSFDAAAKRLREIFLESVEMHLQSDVPVGSCLSGGIDSSSIVMAMRHLRGDDLELHTFSFIAGEQRIDEERWVDIVGDAAGAVLHKVRARPEELVNDLPHLVDLQEEPFGSTSNYAQHRVFRLVSEAGIKVVLDGQGADEQLAGYLPYLSTHLASLLQRGRFAAAARFWKVAAESQGLAGLALLPRVGFRFAPHAMRAAAAGHRHSVGVDPRWFRERGISARPFDAGVTGRSLIAELIESVATTSLPALLRYEDRNSMHYSVESRVPFLVPKLVEFVLSLPEDYLIGPDGTTKRVFRAAMRGIVPDPILDRRDKIGFATPEFEWLTTLRPWVEETLDIGRLRRVPALDPAAVRAHWDSVVARRVPFDTRVWRWVNVVRWAERFDVRF